MMNKKSLIIISIVVIALFLGAVFLLLQAPQDSEPNRGQRIETAQETKLKNFVDNYLSLYNSYSSEDYSNLYAVGSFSTEDLQVQIVQTIANLEQSTPENFERRTTADPSSLTYAIRNDNTMTAVMKGAVTETLQGKQATYRVSATFELTRTGDTWLVNNISLQTE